MNTPQLYSNVHHEDVLGFGRNGGTDYQQIVNFLDLTKKEVANISGVSAKSVRYDDRIPPAIVERLDQINIICQLVAEHFRDIEKTALWFKTPNPLLGNVSPGDMIRFGRYKKLLQFIQDARSQAGDGSEKEKSRKE